MIFQREAIIFIHGFYLSRDRDYFLDCLSKGFTQVLEVPRVEEAGEEKILGYIGKKFKVYIDKRTTKEVDVYDAYWNDLFDKQLSKDSLKNQVFRGIYMLFFWLLTKNLLTLRSSPPLVIGLGVALLIWGFWFYGIIALAFVALGQDPNFLGFPIPEEWSSQISSFGKRMSNFPAWLIVSGLFSFLPINAILDMLDFSTRYLEENPEGKFMRAKIRKQVADTLNAVLETGYYNKVTILAHSFGVVVATDLVADYQQNHRVRYISMGGCLEFLSYKYKQIKTEIIKSLNNEQIDKWIDFYSEQDWLCTKTPIPKGSDSMRICHRKIQFPFSLFEQLSGQSHQHYFINEEVLKTALNLENEA